MAPAGQVEFSEDGRWVTVRGRRWRAADPEIPKQLRAELVAELMDARRAVGRQARRDDLAGVALARRRVADAKVALGERGRPWWEQANDADRRIRLEAAVRALTAQRAPGTICPSDAARVAGGGHWRTLMDVTRDIARDMAIAGELEVLQRGAVIDPTVPWRGPVRLRRPLGQVMNTATGTARGIVHPQVG